MEGGSGSTLVTEPCLSIMDSFVVREKVADMTCRSQLSSGGEKGRPLKLTMSLHRRIYKYIYIHRAAMHGCACKSWYTLHNADRNTHAHTCTRVKDMAVDQGW